MEDILINNLIQIVEDSFISNFKNCNSIEVALSGGIDSVVLLDILYRLKDKYKFNLYAVHVNHNLNEYSYEWGLFCQKVCDYYKIKLRVEEVNIDVNSGLGIEAQARKIRYKCFLGSSCKVVALAHHMNDQVETYFLSILRGGDLRGLVSMPVKRYLGNNIFLWRPLLNITRTDIKAYKGKFNLINIEDISNKDTYFLRNWVRCELIPFIEKKVPNLSKHIIQSIKILQQSLDSVESILKEDYKKVVINNKINILKLRLLPDSRQKELLKFVINNNLGNFTSRWLNNLHDNVIKNPSKNFKYSLAYGYIYSYNGFLWIWCKNNTLYNFVGSNYKWEKSHINWEFNKEFGLNKEFLKSNWSIKCVNKQDIIFTKIGNKRVYKLLQEKKIPPFLRKIWPVIIDENNNCIVLIGIAININYISNNGFLPKIKLLDLYFNVNELK